MSSYVNYGSGFQGRRAAVQSVYYPAAKNANAVGQFQAQAGQAGFESDQCDAPLPQQQFGFSGVSAAAPASGAGGVISAAGSITRPSAFSQTAPAPSAFVARSPAAPISAAAPVAPSAYIESTYLAAGIPNQQFHLAGNSSLTGSNSFAKAQSSACDQVGAFDAAGAAASESAIREAQAAYNDAISKVNEARARLSELGAASTAAPLSGFSFELANPAGSAVNVAAVGRNASGAPQAFGVRFAEQAETISAASTPASSAYNFKANVISAPSKKHALAESVYFGMPNNLHYAASQPQAFNAYSNVPVAASFAPVASESDVATAVLDNSAGLAAPEVVQQAPAQSLNRNVFESNANSDYHLDALRY